LLPLVVSDPTAFQYGLRPSGRSLFLLLPLGEEGAEALGHRVVDTAALDVLQQQVAQVFNVLVNRLHKIPMDDRANVMVEWVQHLTYAYPFNSKGISPISALALSQGPGSYPLSTYLLDSDDDNGEAVRLT
jgi:hypothetical protein